jgi:hypothetical protein
MTKKFPKKKSLKLANSLPQNFISCIWAKFVTKKEGWNLEKTSIVIKLCASVCFFGLAYQGKDVVFRFTISTL